MSEQTSLFDIGGELEHLAKIKSNDWKWSFKDYPKEKNGLKVFSCFACGGGSTMGYKLAGCEVVGCLEIDKKMNDVYIKNHNPKHNFLMDIREFNKLDNLPQELYDLDILDGSPPCTTFSMAGQREESWGKKKKFREGQSEQTLDDLSFVFIDTAKKLQPKIVIMENVEGLLQGNAWEYVRQIYTKFNAIGYQVKHWLIKGEDMGVPQTRHRIIFVATKLSYDLNKISMDFNYEQIPLDIVKSNSNKEINKNTKKYKLLLLATKQCRDIADVCKLIGIKEQGFTDNINFNNEVSHCIKANGHNYKYEEKEEYGKQDFINISTFPQDYNFIKSNVQYICGMSVPPLMMKRVVQRLTENGLFDYKQYRSSSIGGNIQTINLAERQEV